MNASHPPIAREGWPFLAVAFLCSLITTWISPYCAIPLWMITLFMLQFFRDPIRSIPQDVKAILCPADGRIVAMEKTLDPYRHREALKISIFMNVFNVHSQRSPVDCTVQKVEYYCGSFLNAAIDKASLENERNAVLAQLDDGTEITFVQIAGLVARRILCYIEAGDRVARGQRYGFIRFGSRVDVYLPLGTRPKVVIGDKVSASETILAELT